MNLFIIYLELKYIYLVPIRKQKHSDALDSNIDGPTVPSILPMCFGIDSPLSRGFL